MLELQSPINMAFDPSPDSKGSKKNPLELSLDRFPTYIHPADTIIEEKEENTETKIKKMKENECGF